MFFRVKVGDRTFELDKLTLGEARVLKKEFGLKDLQAFSGADPDQLVGLLYLALLRENPALAHAEALAEVEGLDIESFGVADEDEPDPTVDVSTDGSTPPETSGSPVTTPKTGGTPGSRKPAPA